MNDSMSNLSRTTDLPAVDKSRMTTEIRGMNVTARQFRASWLAPALVVLASCAAPQAPASGPTARATSGGAPEPRFHTPTGLLPAAAPVTTYGPNGERVDAIGSLQALLDAGEVTFSHDSVTGYLPSLLAALDIPISSQSLIFSRTSLQTEMIAPWAPRAVYFNDDIYIGYVQESPMLEVASVDPDGGSAFYILPQDPATPPKFRREGALCLGCHTAGVTEGVPGVMVRSVFTGRQGRPVTVLHEGATTDQTPMADRFSGWYVTGTHAGASHGGNVRADVESHEVENTDAYLGEFDMTTGANVTDLTDRFDTSVYLSEHSDLVALLVLAHQTRVHNIITLAAKLYDEALAKQEARRVTTGEQIPEGGLTASADFDINGAVDRLVRAMLFSRAAPLEGPLAGTSGFADEFTARGPVDSRGRSLRDFNLDDRLFEYPLSFLVYTDAFDALPPMVKDRFYRRVDSVLAGTDQSGDFEHLTPALRTAIRDILVATKPDFEAALR